MTSGRGLSDDLISIRHAEDLAHQLSATSGCDDPFQGVEVPAQLLKDTKQCGQRTPLSTSVPGHLDLSRLINND